MSSAGLPDDAPPARLSPLAQLFARHGVPEPLSAILRRGEIDSDAIAENLRPALASHFDYAALDPARMAQPMLLAGPPGCGKTATVAKIAEEDDWSESFGSSGGVPTAELQL